ncbi:NADP-dependent glyceraldehyde-3-phosphate dehydrogenase [Algoriphagus halophytocola]|uniref:NADP-dependent glyceraldehyde-3-phosphate dehydrogenase n=1 Tax=Algoriphagus halophytocola TaxID=2991499 RepID=A0ABY6MJ31_9BACT|nr:MULTISPECIES: NADP-dependent glyceraldehyde-3-phosphate dehydrogenase [unclassified Algoriphagus]UZD23792.1 NADP-dependent glyceraldehyde-3-phosphate dehydrogenase [Algoriphagus sp. TR-M5]WBL45086.1 NADP-dependent glyceraldehyde-3-phosphate dehydrogenase [Algoriphagus sp. TR-M9]
MSNLNFPKEGGIPEEFKLREPVLQKSYLCNGEMKSWTGKAHDVFSPVCVEKPSGLSRVFVGSYPVCTEVEAMQALDAAEAAYKNGRGEWPTMSVSARIKCIEKFTQKMLEKREEVAKLIMWEIGKTYADSLKEYDRTVEYIYATVDALKDLDRQSAGFDIVDGIAAQIRRSPLGVVLCMGPFNYPLNETFTTLIPALIMGNTVLFKPPKHGSLLHFPLLEAFAECFPKGVVNTVYGRGANIIPPLMKSGRINVLTLIGSSKVADQLKKLHPKVNRLRAILGLDAKNAAIVTANADLDQAVKECLTGSLSFNGQRCTAIKIIFVHQDVVHTFNEKFVAALKTLKLGMPWESGVNITPLPEPQKPAYLTECIQNAIENGAQVLNENGGEVNESFVYPAVVFPVNEKMKLYREEQFGPVIPILPFESIEEPIEYLIESPHGQQVSLFSSDSEELADLIDPLVNQVSRVNINSQCQRGPDVFPFTGRKDSAEGTLSVSDALRSFSIRSLVAAKLTDQNKALLNDIISDEESNFLSTKFIF